MSSATLLKKTRAKYNISGRSKNAKMGIRGPHGSGLCTSQSGGGFSINGPHRIKGRVGKTSLFSSSTFSKFSSSSHKKWKCQCKEGVGWI